MFLINFDLAANLDVEQSGARLAPKVCLGDLLALVALQGFGILLYSIVELQ